MENYLLHGGWEWNLIAILIKQSGRSEVLITEKDFAGQDLKLLAEQVVEDGVVTGFKLSLIPESAH